MPTIKIPKTFLLKDVPDWTNYIAMDADKTWYALKYAPAISEKHKSWIVSRNIKTEDGDIQFITRHPYKKNPPDWRKAAYDIGYVQWRKIKVPMANGTYGVPKWANYIAMNSRGGWYAFRDKPYHNKAYNCGSYHYSFGMDVVAQGTKCEFIGLKTPELLSLLDGEKSLFKVEEVLCEE